MSQDAAEQRHPTPIDALAERYLDAAAALDPIMATQAGLAGYDDRLPDLSPVGLAAVADLQRATLAELAQVEAVDDIDRVTVAALAERLGVSLDLDAAGVPLAELNVIASPVQSVRSVFDLMPTDTEQDWATMATRLGAVPAALAGYRDSLRLAADRGDVAPVRQVRACVTQIADNLGPDGFFARLVGGAPAELPATLQAELGRAAAGAQDAYAALSAMLADELLPRAPEADAVGAERYALHSRNFLGTTVDLAESYAWGVAELARIDALMRETADRIRPGATVAEAIAVLDADPSRVLTGTDALQAWMQTASDAAVTALADTHFDIPDEVRRLECRIAPTHTGVIYYTGPSDDFSRPGRMWWSVPTGVEEFSTWRELSTVYHEGVPGHHLQIGQTVYRRRLLNRWRRLASWTSGYGEGWALYAEWLMADLGFLDDPGNRLGMLDGQSMRAARVVIDIGMHCGFAAPAEVGGGDWTYDKAWQLLRAHANMPEPVLRYELDRYLGWPGQAPSYKLGERVWLQLRDEVRARQGAAFDLKAFHRRALDIGGVGLDVLRSALLDGPDVSGASSPR